MTVRIQTGPFDAQAEADALREGDLEVGAVVTFVGTVRDVNDGDAVAPPGATEICTNYHTLSRHDALPICA